MTGGRWVEVMEGECCILCREVYPTAVCAQWGLSPPPVCQWEHMSLGHTNTSVSRLQSPHQSDHSAQRCSVITHHRLLWRGDGWGESRHRCRTPSLPSASLQACVGKTERVRKIGRVSEWEGRWGKDSPVWDREAGDPPPSCEKLETVCASTSGLGRTSWKDWCENSPNQNWIRWLKQRCWPH